MNTNINSRVHGYIIGDDIPIDNKEGQFIHVNDYEELTLSEPSICILSLSPVAQNKALLHLHSKQSIWNCQVYVLQESTLSPYLSDGILEPNKIVDKWEIHQEKLALIKEEPLDKLLAWLWLGSQRRLAPLCQSERQDLYYYPLMQCYSGEDNSPYTYFQLEEKRGYLEREKTIDKVRLCSYCHSGHLNYIETCPDCKSTNIEEMVSLHCFTCGHIAEESQFTQQDKLSCPNCLTQLRHIGVDYDRPLERYQCEECKLLFSESVVRARCLSCSLVNETNELIARKINQFRVGEQVKSLMMYGRRPLVQELKLNGLIDQKSFHNLLSWVNKLAIRHQQSHLLLGVKLSGIEAYSQQFGEIKRLQLIEEISNHFNRLLRDTDICCHYSSEIMLLLMPMTPIDSYSIIESKIAKIANDIESELITLNVYLWQLPSTSLSDNAPTWLAQLIKGNSHE